VSGSRSLGVMGGDGGWSGRVWGVARTSRSVIVVTTGVSNVFGKWGMHGVGSRIRGTW
jgi:hypothetical protein